MSGIFETDLFWLVPIGATVVSMAAFALFATPLTAIAATDPAWARRYRIRDRIRDTDGIVSRGIRVWLMNNLVMTAVAVAGWPLLRATGIHAGPVPAAWVIAAQVLFFIYLDDFLFYWSHRALHTRWLYRNVHAVHHRIMTPWAVTGHDMHVIEFVLIGLLVLIGPVLVGAHVLTIWIWIVIRQWEAAEGHSGYDLPYSPTKLLPGSDGAVHHDWHHRRIRGNYAGFLAVVDGLLSTMAKGYPADRAVRGRRLWLNSARSGSA